MVYILFVFLNAFFVERVYARLEDRLGNVTGSGQGTGEDAVADFINSFLDFAVPLGVFAAFVLLGYAAFVMITSAGNPEKLKDAREIITNAIVGVVMIAMGVIILSLLAGRLDIPGLNN